MRVDDGVVRGLTGVLGLFVGRDAPKKRRADVVAAERSGWTLVLAGAPLSIHERGIIDLGVLASESMPLLYHAATAPPDVLPKPVATTPGWIATVFSPRAEKRRCRPRVKMMFDSLASEYAKPGKVRPTPSRSPG